VAPVVLLFLQTREQVRNKERTGLRTYSWGVFFISIKIIYYTMVTNIHNTALNTNHVLGLFGLVWCIVFNATFNNISVISWRSALLVEETGVPGESHRSVASHWQNLSHNAVEYNSPWTGFELTTLVVIGIDCTCSCKSNYHDHDYNGPHVLSFLVFVLTIHRITKYICIYFIYIILLKPRQRIKITSVQQLY
jgi:hypothetical protein